MNLKALVLALVLGLAFAVYLWQGSASTPELDPQGSNVKEMQPATPVTESGQLTADVPATSGTRVEGPAAQERPGVEFVVEVLLRDTKAPVAGARVQYVDWGALDSDEMREVMRTGSDPQQMIERFADESRTNASGRVTLRWSGSEAIIVASHDGMRGMLPIRRVSDTPMQLLLVPEKMVSVEVVDATGRKQSGVPVGIADRIDRPRFRWAVRGLTDQDGVWSPPYLGQRFANETKLFAGLNFPASELVSASFPFDVLPEEPVQLQLPPTGEVIVEVRNSRGQSVAAGDVWVCENKGDERTLDFQARSTGISQPVVDGEARFPYVGLDVELFFLFRSIDGAEVRHAQAGPLGMGETVVVSLEVEDQPILVGRLIDGAGKPFANAAFKGSFLSMGGSHGVSRLLDADGRFRIVVPERFREPSVDKTVLFDLDGQQAQVELAAMLPNDEIDLGDITLSAGPVLASGRVVDPNGNGIADATVGIEKVFHQNREDGRTIYLQVNDLMEQTDAAGNFEIRGPIPEEPELALRARKFGYADSEPSVLALGSANNELRLERSGSVEGSLLLPDGMDPKSVRCSLSVVPPGGVETRLFEGTWTGGVKQDGTVEWLSVPAGTYTFRLLSSLRNADLLTVDGIVVRSGETTRDPRLQKIDLASLMNTFTVEVVDEEDQAVESAVVWITRPGESSMVGARNLGGGRFECTIPIGESVTVIARSNGYRGTELENVSTDRRAVLRRGIVATVRLLGSAPLIDGATRLTVMFQNVESAGNRVRPAQAFDASRELRLSFPGPGTYRVLWGFAGSNSARGFTQLAGSGEELIEIVDDSSDQLIELTPDPGWVATARKQLGQ